MNDSKDYGSVQGLIYEEDGMGVVEVILIIVVLISLVIIFRDNIQSVVRDVMKKVKEGSQSIDYQ